MFTQCPECETIFKLSAEVLRAAAGEVRCGRCGEIFNALRSLAEEPRAFTTGESLHEQEARADNILRFVPPAESPTRKPSEFDEDIEHEGSPGTQIAHLEIQGAEDLMSWSSEDQQGEESFTRTIADDPSMEFTLPPGELDKIFIEARPRDFGRLKPSPAAGQRAEIIELSDPEPIGSASADAGTTESDAQAVHGAEPAEFVPTRLRSLQFEESIERVILPQSGFDEQHAPAPHRGRWIAAAVLFAALLGAQVIHHNRDSLAQAAGIGAALRSFYEITGNPLPLRTDLAAFEVRQWGVTGDASANGTLRVRASVINTGATAQPYPLLRLTLADRFGTHVGTRDFKPGEYLRKKPTRALDPGERADAIIEILDPGKTAEGFEIDVCDQPSDSRVICANDAPARAR